MKKPKRQILTGMDLWRALKAMRPTHLIKIMVDGKTSHNITVDMATCIVRASTYEGEFRHGRVFKIRTIDNRTSNKHDHSFRDGRSCLQFTPITRKTIDIWDKVTRKSQVIKTP